MPTRVSTRATPALGLCLALAASIAIANPEAGEGWELETTNTDADADAGWTLYTAEVEGSDHRRYRLITELPDPVPRVAQALRLKLNDVRYMQAGYDRTILSRGDGFMINYVRMDVPIVADRDVILETRWWTDPASAVHHVSWAPPAGEVPPIPDGVSRIESRGSWEIAPLASGGSKVVYTQHTELGDSMPAWLVGRLMNAQIISEYTTLAEILSSEDLSEDPELPAVAAPPLAAAGVRPLPATSESPNN